MLLTLQLGGYHYLSSRVHPVWAAENQSISSSRWVDVSGITALSCLFVNHSDKYGKADARICGYVETRDAGTEALIFYQYVEFSSQSLTVINLCFLRFIGFLFFFCVHMYMSNHILEAYFPCRVLFYFLNYFLKQKFCPTRINLYIYSCSIILSVDLLMKITHYYIEQEAVIIACEV